MDSLGNLITSAFPVDSNFGENTKVVVRFIFFKWRQILRNRRNVFLILKSRTSTNGFNTTQQMETPSSTRFTKIQFKV